MLLSGDEAVAWGARDSGLLRGTGYPATPSPEILEGFAGVVAHAPWAPNGKVALEPARGAAYAGGGAIATMRHAGLNVAADPLFALGCTTLSGPLGIIDLVL